MELLRVLHIEDSAPDHEIIVDHLRIGGFDVEAQRVDTYDAAESALRPGGFDIVLCDFSLPGFDGMAALKVVRRLDAEIPFIFVSGTIGEVRAIETIKEGGTDYVLKSSLNRLVPSVKRALRETRERLKRKALEVELAQRAADLERLNEQLRDQASLLDKANDAIMVRDLQHKITYWNKSCERLYGWTAEEAIGRSVAELLFKDKSIFDDARKRLLRDGEWSGELEKINRNGAPLVVEAHWTLVRDAEGIPKSMLDINTDISHRKHAEKVLRASEERYRTLFEKIDEGFCVVEMIYDSSGRPVDYLFVEVNPAFEHQTGLKDALEKTIRQMVPNHDTHWYEIYGKVARTGESMRFQSHAIALERYYDVLAFRVEGEKSGRVGILFNDITERKKADIVVQEQARLLKLITDAIVVIDPQDRVTYWNKGAENLYGWSEEEVLGKHVSMNVDSAEFENAKSALMVRGQWSGELQQVMKGGNTLTVDSRWTLTTDEKGQALSILMINTDITFKKEVESQIMRSQRLESIGTLAGGIAHDLNNVLGPIMLSIQVLRQRVQDPKGLHLLEIIDGSANRGASIVKQVLSFARGTRGEQMALQLRSLMTDLGRILKSTFPPSIEIVIDVPRTLWPVFGDPSQLDQLLMNLCVNARDAMPGGGQLFLTAENINIDERSVHPGSSLKAGKYVCVTVKDTGLGISTAIIDRIFDPFFTTKDIGKGTGLGLSTVASIARSHGGHIEVFSQPEKGTEFKVWLPATDLEVRAETNDSGGLSPPMGDGELILLVDDEAAVREILRETLQSFGYSVLTADDGIQAIWQYHQNKDKIAVVVTDVMMPYMDGLAIVDAIRKSNPELKVIVISGLMEQEKLETLRKKGGISVLLKPFSGQQLLLTLGDILHK